MNELKKLITDYQKTHHLTRNTLIQKLGYKNIAKGLRRLDAFIERPTNNAFKAQLCKQLDIPILLLDEVVNNQLSNMPKQAKVIAFIPYIQINWLKGPSLLMDVKQLQHLYRIEIPNNFSKPTFEQVYDLYKQHQLKHFAEILNVPNTLEHYPQYLEAIETKIKDGIYISWALGNGFTYHKAFNKSYRFNRLGEQIVSANDHNVLEAAWDYTNNKVVVNTDDGVVGY